MDLSASPTLALGVVGASLLGSAHCAAMCGGFACLYGGDSSVAPSAGAASVSPTSATSARTGHVAYHGGRLLAYTALGAAAGALGAGLDQVGQWAGVPRAAGIAAGLLLVLWGAGLLATQLNVRRLHFGVNAGTPEGIARFIGGLLLRLRARTPGRRAFALGLLTGLIPCGWLYAFVVAAGGTGSAWRGAAFMALFWIGTVPALVAIAIGMRRATGALQRRLPIVSAVLVIALGLSALGGRILAAPTAAAPDMTHVH